MENITTKYPGLVECIKKVILKIREKYTRPCCQNILTFVNRSGIEIDMDDLKIVLNDLIESNIIMKKVYKKEESFYVNTKDTEILSSDEEDKDDGGHFDLETEGISCENLSNETLINEKFYEFLINKIKSEVKNAVNELIPNSSNRTINNDHVKLAECGIDKEHDNNYNKLLINALQSEIKFLRNEILSKNTVIKMLINDTNNNTHNAKKPDINIITENERKMSNVVNSKADEVKKHQDNTSCDDINDFVPVKKRIIKELIEVSLQLATQC